MDDNLDRAVRGYVKRHREFEAGASDGHALLDLLEERLHLMRRLGQDIDSEITRIGDLWRTMVCRRMSEAEAVASTAAFRKTLRDLAALWRD
jgi:hypothetical protein